MILTRMKVRRQQDAHGWCRALTLPATVALIVMAGAIAGGYVGGRFARSMPNLLLRHLVTAAGVIFSIVYFVRAYG